jgi:hypothetical protein
MRKITFINLSAIFFLAGCARRYNEGGQPSSSSTNTVTVKTQGVVLTCESYGAKLVIDTVPMGLSSGLEARLSGKASEYIRDEQGKEVTAQGGGYDAGKTWKTKKQLPKTFVHNFESGSAPVVVIQWVGKRELNGELLGYFKGQYDPSIVKERTGFKVVIPYFEMTGSHTTASYEYANWFFADKDCK